MKKILIITGFILLTGNAFAESPLDATDPYLNTNADLGIERCIAKGNVDFGLFLDSLIYSDGIYEGVIEPFNDVLFRNTCQALDISGLVKQRDKIKGYIREAFLTCKSEKVPNLKRALYEVNAEIYYARHIVDGMSLISIPFTEQSVINTTYIYPREKLYKEMWEKYGDTGVFTQEKFNVLFNRLETKYADRKNNYVYCPNPSFELLSQKFSEFVNTAFGLAPAWEDMKSAVGGRAEKIWESATDFTYNNFLLNTINISINDQALLDTYDDIYEELQKQNPFPVVGTGPGNNTTQYYRNVTKSEVSQAANQKEFEQRVLTVQNSLKAKYSVLYKDTSDSSVELFLNELNSLEKAIVESFTPMNNVLSCVEYINGRQCPGSI